MCSMYIHTYIHTLLNTMIHCVTLKFDIENICPMYIHTYIHVHTCTYIHVMSCGGLILHKNIYVHNNAFMSSLFI